MTVRASTSPVPDWDWWPHPLPENVSFGEGCWLHSGAAFGEYRSTRRRGVRVGSRTGLYKGVSFHLGPDGEIEIGDHCTIVSAVFITNRRIEIGSCVLVSSDVLLADRPDPLPPHGPDAAAYRRVMTPDGPPMVIGDDVWIGTSAVVVGGVTLGRGAVVGAATVVDRDVPDYGIVVGNPSRLVGFAYPFSAAGAASRSG